MCSHNLTESIHFNHNLRVGFFFFTIELWKCEFYTLSSRGGRRVRGGGVYFAKCSGGTFQGKKIYFYDTDVYESSNSFYGDSVWFAQKLCMRCHARTLLEMIDIVMNLSLPLSLCLIFTASFQNYLIITVQMVFFNLYMRHTVGLVFLTTSRT